MISVGGSCFARRFDFDRQAAEGQGHVQCLTRCRAHMHRIAAGTATHQDAPSVFHLRRILPSLEERSHQHDDNVRNVWQRTQPTDVLSTHRVLKDHGNSPSCKRS
jgi:hypothetical protein